LGGRQATICLLSNDQVFLRRMKRKPANAKPSAAACVPELDRDPVRKDSMFIPGLLPWLWLRQRPVRGYKIRRKTTFSAKNARPAVAGRR
jgi:hypothetical protein